MYLPFYFDSTYFLVLIGVVISLWASSRVKSTYAKYDRVRNQRGLTGRDAAQQILQNAGIHDVRIEHVAGDLSDHYDPRSKVLRLSDATYNSASVAAVGVAAHECGHVLQHAKGYAPLAIRTSLVPVANFGSMIAWPLIIIGLFITTSASSLLINLGIIAFSAAVLFQIVTLPVEYNASSRALSVLSESHLLYDEELQGAEKVLKAAALTYVAAAAASILQLLRILLLSGRRRN
ncbi:MAG: zinc metallopeptidase [Lachnospiraceae bacterium]